MTTEPAAPVADAGETPEDSHAAGGDGASSGVDADDDFTGEPTTGELPEDEGAMGSEVATDGETVAEGEGAAGGAAVADGEAGTSLADATPDGGVASSSASDTEEASAELAADQVASGQWGSCDWELTTDGVLTIHAGEGAILESGAAVPWDAFRSGIKQVVMESGVVLPSKVCYMFDSCTALTSVDASGWDMSHVTSTRGLFYDCTALKSLDLSGWDLSSVEGPCRMLDGCTSLESIDLSGARMPKDASGLFNSLKALSSLDTTDIDTSLMTSTHTMFAGCSSLRSLDLSGWDVSNVTNMSTMFPSCTSLETLNLASWDVSNVLSMGMMFISCKNLETLDLSGWNPSSLMSMTVMFNGCSSLTSLDLSGWDTSNVTSMTTAFAGCTSLRTLDLSGWDTSRAQGGMQALFDSCASLEELRLGEGFKFGEYCTLPKNNADADGRWFSAKDQAWYSPADIAANRSGIADTYTKYGLLDDAKVTLPQGSYDYAGSAVKPKPTVMVGETTLVEGTDYTVSYSGNDKAGTATVTVTGKGAYAGTASATFTIKAASIAGATVTVSPTTLTYDGTARRPKVTVKVGGKTLKEGTDYAVSWSGGPTFGKLTAKVTGKGSYTGSKTAANCCRINFTDTPVDAWYQTQGWLDYVVNDGIMTGIKDAKGFTGAFAPEATVTRAQVAVVLFRYANPGNDATSNAAHYGTKCRFHDVAPGQWHTAAIEWCAEKGIVTGYGTTGNFGPDDPVTREQLAAMMYRFAKSQGANGAASVSALSKAPDASAVSGWARDAVAWCAANKVITGYAQDGRIDPQGSATRAQLAKIITVVTRDVL